MFKSCVCRLWLFHDLSQTEYLLTFHFQLCLVYIHVLHFPFIVSCSGFDNSQEFFLLFLHNIRSNIPKLCILSYLVCRSGTHRGAIQVQTGLLSHVNPHHRSRLVSRGELCQSSLEASQGWLTTAIHLVSRAPSPVRNPRYSLRQLL